MSDPIDTATGIMKHWEAITGAAVGILAIFGVIIKRRDGKTIVTQKDLDLLDARIEARIFQCAFDIKKAINESANGIYADINKKDAHVNNRIDDILKDGNGKKT